MVTGMRWRSDRFSGQKSTVSSVQAGHSGPNIWQAGRWFRIEYLAGRQEIQEVIQDRISGRQVGGADGYLIEYLVDRWVVQEIFDEIPPAPPTYLSDIRSWITCLPARYSVLNYLPACQIFDSELPACLPDIRFWITCLSVRYSILNYLLACQIFDPESRFFAPKNQELPYYLISQKVS